MHRFRISEAALAVLLTLALAACGPAPENAPTVLIGVDGAEWDVINDMIADGELPTLARIKREGAWGHLLNPGPAISPVVWTTFATGHFGRQHGILGHTFPYQHRGGKRPVTSELRQVPALWNIASHHGLRSAVVGYFVTHPAESIDGVIISPLAPLRAPSAIAPPEALSIDEKRYRELRNPEVRRRLWSRFLGWDFDPAQAEDPGSPYQHAAQVVMERNIEKRIVADEFLRRAALDLAEAQTDLFIAYFRLPDFMSHSLWLFYDDSDFSNPADPFEQELFGESLKESYRFVDEAIGELLTKWQGQANVMIVSDHGFGSSLSMERGEETRSSHLTGNHRPHGVMLATGPAIQPGEHQGMTIMDVAPTLLALLGLPVSDELPGEVSDGLLRPELWAAKPLLTASSYAGITAVQREGEIDVDALADDMSALRGLGYVGEDVELDSVDSDGDYDFWSADDLTVVNIIASEIMYFLVQGDVEAAQASHDLLVGERGNLNDSLVKKVQGRYLAMVAQLSAENVNTAPFNAYIADNPKIGTVSDAREKRREARKQLRREERRK